MSVLGSYSPRCENSQSSRRRGTGKNSSLSLLREIGAVCSTISPPGILGLKAPFAKDQARKNVFPSTGKVCASHQTPAVASNTELSDPETRNRTINHMSPREKEPKLAPKPTVLIDHPSTLLTHCPMPSHNVKKRETPPSGDTGEHHFSQRAGKLFESNRTTETNTHLQSREQQQRNINSETKTQILAHKMRHMTKKRSATRAANDNGVSQDGRRMATPDSLLSCRTNS